MKVGFGSHLAAELAGWAFPATYGEVMTAIAASSTVNSNRDTKAHPDPFVLPMPWTAQAEEAEQVTDDELAELRARLNAASAFGS